MEGLASCFYGRMAFHEGAVWWSLSPKGTGKALPAQPITERALEDWLSDTVGWYAIHVTGDAFQAAGAHSTQIRPLVQAAFEAVERINTHKCLIRTVDIDAQMGACLRMALCAYSNLQKFILSELNVYDEAVLELCSGLASTETLTKLTLDQVDLGCTAWAALMKALSDNQSIRLLKMRGCCDRSAVEGLAGALPHIHVLQALDLKGNNIRDSCMKMLCDALAKNNSVTSLNVSECGLSSAGAVAAAGLIRHSPVLKRLELSHNKLGPEGCWEIGSALSASQSLQHLGLSRTGCDDKALGAIVNSLELCYQFTSVPLSNLTSLDLGYGRITPVGSLRLAREARKGNLREVSLSGNCLMGTEGVVAWAQHALNTTSCGLTRIALSDCEAGDEAAFAIAEALKPEGSLSSLELASNQFKQPSISALIGAARKCPRMHMLDVSFNWVGPRAMEECLAENAPDKDGAEASASGDLAQESSPEDQLTIKRELLLEFRRIEAVKCSTSEQAMGESTAGKQEKGKGAQKSGSSSSSLSRSSSGETRDSDIETDSTATQASSRAKSPAPTVVAPTEHQFPSEDTPQGAEDNPFLVADGGQPGVGAGIGDGGASWATLAETDGLLDATINMSLPVSVHVPLPPPSPSPKPTENASESALDSRLDEVSLGSGAHPKSNPFRSGLDTPVGAEEERNPFRSGLGTPVEGEGAAKDGGFNPFLSECEQHTPEPQQVEEVQGAGGEQEPTDAGPGVQGAGEVEQQEQEQEREQGRRDSNPFLEPEFERRDSNPFLEQEQERRDSNPFLEQEQEQERRDSNPFLVQEHEPCVGHEQRQGSNPFLEH